VGAKRLGFCEVTACNQDIDVILSQKLRKTSAKYAITAEDEDFHGYPFRWQVGMLG
jgi:hypothetical protein